MPSITFDLETVTPLFLAGADQTEAELRPPAFRGALRYWFRAIAASVTDWETVKVWENKIFGNTEAGGQVIIRIQAEKIYSKCVLKKDEDLTGLSYLYFSVYKRGCLPPNHKFKLILQTRFIKNESEECLKLATCAAWLLFNLGGLGSRSNRGGGNLKVTHEPKNNCLALSFINKAINVEELSKELKRGIDIVKDEYQKILKGNLPNLSTRPEFDILSSKTANLYLWQSKDVEDNEDWDYILNAFGDLYKNFRLRYNQATSDDYKEIKAWLKNNGKTTITTVKRAAFGLPIQFYFTSLNKKKASVEATDKINRSSSPIHLKVIELVNQQKVILLICFKTQLIPSNQRILVKSKDVPKSVTVDIPNQDIITNEFIPSLGKLTNINL